MENLRKFVGVTPEQNLVDFHLNSNRQKLGNCSGPAQSRIWLIGIWILTENLRKFVWAITDLGHPKAESGWCSFKFKQKIWWNWSGPAQSRIWLICIWILIENVKKIIWASPKKNLVDFHLNFNRKSKEILLGQLRTESGWFSFEF